MLRLLCFLTAIQAVSSCLERQQRQGETEHLKSQGQSVPLKDGDPLPATLNIVTCTLEELYAGTVKTVSAVVQELDPMGRWAKVRREYQLEVKPGWKKVWLIPGHMVLCLLTTPELAMCVSVPPPPGEGKEKRGRVLEAPVRKMILQMPERTSQCWSQQTPAWTRCVHRDAPGQRHRQQPVSGTGVVKQDKSSGGSRGPTGGQNEQWREADRRRQGKQSDTDALCHRHPPPPGVRTAFLKLEPPEGPGLFGTWVILGQGP